MNEKIPISVIVLTLNEAELIARCVSCLDWAAEVLVIDSGSSDDTGVIAEKLGARVVHQAWLGYSQQRNTAAHLAVHDWVLQLDTDEIVSDELVKSIAELFAGSTPAPTDGYAVDRRGDFLGKLLPNPSRPEKRKRFVRLYNRLFSKFDEAVLVHEEVQVPGTRHMLEGILIHWRGSTIDEYVRSFNRYAVLEARELNNRGTRATVSLAIARPLARFGWLYIVKGGWMVGPEGLISAGLKLFSELDRYLNLLELQDRQAVFLDGISTVLPSGIARVDPGSSGAAATNTFELVAYSHEIASRIAADQAPQTKSVSVLALIGRPIASFIGSLLKLKRLPDRSVLILLAASKSIFFDFVVQAKLWEMLNSPRSPNPPEQVYPSNRYT